MSTRSSSMGIIASILAIVAAGRPLGLALHPLPIEGGELGTLLGGLIEQRCRSVASSPAGAPSGGSKAARGSPSARAARSRATSSWAATRSLRKWRNSASLIVGSSSISTSPALTVWPSFT
jgi:hypothetical protein